MFLFYHSVCVSSEEQTQVIRLGGKHLYLILMSHPTVPGRCIGLVNIRAGVFPIGNMQAQFGSWMPLLEFQSADGDLESP